MLSFQLKIEIIPPKLLNIQQERLVRFSMIKLLLLILVLLTFNRGSLADEASDLNAPRLVSSDARGFVVEVGVQTYSLQEVQVAGNLFRRMTVPGYVHTIEPGLPAVPFTSVLLGVPEGVDFVITIQEEEITTLSQLRLAPFHDPGMHPDMPGIDDLFYRSNVLYPEAPAEIATTGYLRHQRVAVLSLRPVRYNPIRRELRITGKLRVTVRFISSRAPKPARVPAPRSDRAFEPVYRSSLLNYEDAKSWRTAPPPSQPGLGKVDEEGTWYRPTWTYHTFTIRDDGLYRLDREWFISSGIDPDGVDLDRLKLYVDGGEVPLRISGGSGGGLLEGDIIEFYARFRRSDRDFENPLGRGNVFYLTDDGGVGERVSSIDAAPKNSYPPATFYRAKIHFEQDGQYDPLGLAADNLRDHWYWARIDGPDSSSFGWSINGIDPSGRPPVLRVGMHGLTDLFRVDPDHRALIRLNDGPILGEGIWGGQTPLIIEGEASLSNLREGPNTLTIEVPKETGPGKNDLVIDSVLFNYLDVIYDRIFKAENGVLTFDLDDFQAGRSISVSGLSGPEVVVYDLTRGVHLTGIDVLSDAEGATFEVGPQRPGRYFVAGEAGIRRPPPGIRFGGADLRADRTGADYLMISHKNFLDALAPLVAQREADGLTVKLVDVQDIFHAFGFGQFEPEAIQAYIRYTMTALSIPPAYLLLVGRETFDYRDIFNTGRISYVPSLYFQARERGNAPTDFFYATVLGEDLFPDLSVGRISVSSPEETETVVQKIIGYDTPPVGRWRDRGLFLAGAEDVLVGPSDFMIRTYSEPFGLETTRIYSDQLVPEPNEDTRRFIQRLNEGAVLVNFAGHGSATAMAFFFRGTSQQGNYSFMTKVLNGDRLPFFIAMSCLNGFFAEPRLNCLAEEMVNKPDGGAIAYVSATALGFAFTDSLLNDRMFLHAFGKGESKFGRILNLAKIDLMREFPGITTGVLSMNLVGDPAQNFALLDQSDYAVSPKDVSVNGIPIEDGPALVEGDSVRLGVLFENLGSTSESAVRVLVVDRWLDRTRVDTLFSGVLPPFGVPDSIITIWPIAGAGPHQLSVSIEPGLGEEMDPSNNTVSIPLIVFPIQTPTPMGPVDDQRITSSEAVLTVLNASPPSPGLNYRFEVAPSPIFEGPEVRRSGPVPEGIRVTTWTVNGLSPGVYFWMARTHDSEIPGRWTRTRAFLIDPTPGDETWRQGTPGQLARNRLDGAELSGDALFRVRKPLPARPDSQHREAFIQAEGVSGAGVLCTDGKYLYVKRWYGGPSTVYPGTDVFHRIGTGFEGTVAGRDYGAFPTASTPGISATYHSDGFIYNDAGVPFEIERIDPITGAIDRVQVPSGLLEQRSGLPIEGQFLITSDGRFVYNLAFGVDGVSRAAWKVRVFDPAQGWGMVRVFEIPPSTNGFTYLITDGLIADGDYLYLVEFTTAGRGRIRVVDPLDGAFVDEILSDQPETGIITGQYDPKNNKVWFGKLLGPFVVRYAGKSPPTSSSAMTSPIGPAARWGRLSVETTEPPEPGSGGSVEIGVLGQRFTSGTFEPVPNFNAIQASPSIDLSPIDASTYRHIRLVARFKSEGLASSPGLKAWGLSYTALPVVSLSNLTHDRTEVKELEPIGLSVQVLNLGPTEDLSGAVVAFYAGGPPHAGGQLIGRKEIPSVRIGETITASLIWNTKHFDGTFKVFARTETADTFEDMGAEAAISQQFVTVISRGDTKPPLVEFRSLDTTGEIRPEDFLPPTPRFEVHASDPSGVERSSVKIDVDGEIISLEAPEITGLSESEADISFTLSPSLADGRHSVRVEAMDRLDNGPTSASLSFVVTSDLMIASPLVFPNPVLRDAHFTYLLSQAARVTIRIYSVAGRLVRRIENASGAPGYNQSSWDGLDHDGNPLGNGTYLYVISARNGDQSATARKPLIVLRQ